MQLGGFLQFRIPIPSKSLDPESFRMEWRIEMLSSALYLEYYRCLEFRLLEEQQLSKPHRDRLLPKKLIARRCREKMSSHRKIAQEKALSCAADPGRPEDVIVDILHHHTRPTGLNILYQYIIS